MKKLNSRRLSKIFKSLGESRVLIVGDVMLDCYLWGTVDRISPEAPVPVVNIQKETWTLGGAANVANNLRKLEVEPILIGVAGNDDNSRKLKSLLRKWKISSNYLVTSNRRPTTLKTRIIAHSQQVVRADSEETKEVSQRTQEKILEGFAKNLSKANAVIISDYGKGVITYKLLNEIIELARKKGLFIAVDPKESHFMNYKGASIITPNHHKIAFSVHRHIWFFCFIYRRIADRKIHPYGVAVTIIPLPIYLLYATPSILPDNYLATIAAHIHSGITLCSCGVVVDSDRASLEYVKVIHLFSPADYISALVKSPDARFNRIHT